MGEKKEISYEDAVARLKVLKERSTVCKNSTFDVLESKGKASELLINCHKEMKCVAEASEILLERVIAKLKDNHNIS